MAYSTRENLQLAIDDVQLIQLTDDKDINTIDWDIVDQFRVNADALIDGYIGGRGWTLPLSPVPTIIAKFSDDILIYDLYGRRGGAPEYVKERYMNAIKFLQGIAEGKNSLGIDDPAESETTGDMEFSYNTRTFTRTTMEGF